MAEYKDDPLVTDVESITVRLLGKNIVLTAARCSDNGCVIVTSRSIGKPTRQNENDAVDENVKHLVSRARTYHELYFTGENRK